MANGVLNLPIIKVVGDRTAKVLITQLGIETLGDLLRHYPRRYVARGELTDLQGLVEGEEVTILAEIESTKVRKIPGRKGGILEVVVTDGRAKLSLTFLIKRGAKRNCNPVNKVSLLGKSEYIKANANFHIRTIN